MTEPLRPMTLGEILDRTFQIYRARFWVFVGIAVIPAFVIMGLHLADTAWIHVASLIHPFREPGVTLWKFLVGLGFYHFDSLLILMISPAIVSVASSVQLGEVRSLRAALWDVCVSWRRYLWLAILKLSAYLVIPESLTIGSMMLLALIADAAGWLNGFNPLQVAVILLFPTILGVALFVWVGSCVALMVPIASLESNGGFKALRRSWILSRGTRGRIAVTWVSVTAFTWLSQYGTQYVVRWIAIYIYGQFSVSMTAIHYITMMYVIYAVITTLVTPVYLIASTLFYYDQRIRLEGYDIERMMTVAGLDVPATETAASVAAAEVQGA